MTAKKNAGGPSRGVANAARGSVFVMDAKGQRHELALNMQVLAYVAGQTGITTIHELVGFASNPDMAKMPGFIAAVLAGNGVEVSEADIARLDFADGYAFLQQLIAAMNAAMPEDDASGNGVALSLKAKTTPAT